MNHEDQVSAAENPFALARNLAAASGLSLALYFAVGIQASVVAQTSAPTSAPIAAVPSKLDYVVLASLADSSSLLSITAYRAPAAATAEARKKAPVVTAPQEGE